MVVHGQDSTARLGEVGGQVVVPAAVGVLCEAGGGLRVRVTELQWYVVLWPVYQTIREPGWSLPV